MGNKIKTPFISTDGNNVCVGDVYVGGWNYLRLVGFDLFSQGRETTGHGESIFYHRYGVELSTYDENIRIIGNVFDTPELEKFVDKSLLEYLESGE
jgi:hypothetical protein